MKKSVKNIVLLSIWVVLGSCSIAPVTMHDGVIGTGDAVIDEATVDALNQIGPVSGMTQWEVQREASSGTLVYTFVMNLFISSDKTKYAKTKVEVLDGILDCGDEVFIFRNTLAEKNAEEGTLAIEDTFKLFAEDRTTEITDKKGFTKLYVLTYTKAVIWLLKIFGGGEENWIDDTSVHSIQYRIVKETTTELNILTVVPKNPNDLTEGYYLRTSTSIEDAIASDNNTLFIKK